MTGFQFKRILSIIVITTLAAFEHTTIGLFPPLFQYISKDFQVDTAHLVYVSAINILVTALSSIYWGYLSGKYRRKLLIGMGTLIWVVSIFLTANSQSYTELFLYQVLTGLGLGCIASIGFSILTDFIPFHKRGLVLSFWGMAQGLGGIAGSILASLTVTNAGWRWPFELVGFVGLGLIVLYLFIKEPNRGEADPELKELIKDNQSYSFEIEVQHLKPLLLKRSNVYLFFQAFFMNIATGSYIWIPTLFIYKIMQQGLKMETAVIASGYLYAIFQIGGMTSAYFGHMGDRLQRKSFKGRAVFTSLLVILTMPFYILLFVIPMNHLSLTSSNALVILESLLKQFIVNPWMILMFVISLFASAAQSANTPNWLALITDVNLPEHRGTSFSVANLFNSLGRTIGNLGVGFLLGFLSQHFAQPYSYIWTLSIMQIFLIPSAFCYFKMSKNNVTDITHVKTTLKERAVRIRA